MTWLLILVLTWSLTGESVHIHGEFETEQMCLTYAALKIIETVRDGVDEAEVYCVEQREG